MTFAGNSDPRRSDAESRWPEWDIAHTDWPLLVQETPNHVWRTNPAGKLDFVNARMVEYFGRSVEELLVGGWREAIHPADLSETVQRWQEAVRQESLYEAEYRLLRASDGLYYWHRSRACPVRNADGNIFCWVGTNVEINALRRTVEVADARQEIAQQERERLMRVFHYAPALVALYVGPDYRLMVANPQVEAFFGKRIEIGKPLREILPELENQGILPLLDRVYQTGEPFHALEMRMLLDRNGDGKLQETYWNLVLQPLNEPGEPVYEIMAHAVEVTDLVIARNSAQQLQRQIEQLTAGR